MTIIHMEVDAARSLANQMQRFAETLTQRHQNVNSFVRNIDWSGDARERFSADASSVINSLDKLADHILIASRQLSKEIDQWVTADRTGSKNIQAVKLPDDSSDYLKFIGGGQLLYTWIVGLVKPPQLGEVWEYLKETPTGKDLEKLARENNICFILPNGELIGNPNAVIQIPINYGETIGGGSYSLDNGTITISDNKLLNGGLVGLSNTMAHEMQHAIDHASGQYPPFPRLEGLSESQLEANLEHYFDAHIHSEVRAYERSENILELSQYYDDGVLTGEERNNILTTALEGGTYRSYYENFINGKFDGKYTTTISVDPTTGELNVDLIPMAQPLSEFAYTA